MRKIDLSNFQVATSETARHINRRIVLNLVRTRQPISRADLARISGLQRSTVSLIVEQLIGEKWITEGAVGRVPRGRRPTFLHLNAERARIVGVNVRPTTTTLAIADFDGKIVAQESLATTSDIQEFLKALTTHLKLFLKSHPDFNYEGIGVSLPGRVRHDTEQRLVFAPNVGWRNVDFKAPLEKATGLPVEVENASNACALAEIWFGAHEAASDLVALTVSEGVGAGMVVNGQLVRGPLDMAGEFGHAPIALDGPVCGCGNKACWEIFASNAAALRYYGELTAGVPAKKEARRKPEKMTFDGLLELAARGDEKAGQALDQMAYFLGRGMVMLVNGLSPEVLVVIGEVTRAWPRVGPIIKKVVAEHCRTVCATNIVPADEAVQPRLRGTFALVLQKHFGAPEVA